MAGAALPYTSRPIRPVLADVLRQLEPGMRIEITQTVKIGSTKTWETVVGGTFRHLDSLATGLATQRRPEDDIIVPIVHFAKENGELSSVALDERSVVRILS
jgi:hypothetical protein